MIAALIAMMLQITTVDPDAMVDDLIGADPPARTEAPLCELTGDCDSRVIASRPDRTSVPLFERVTEREMLRYSPPVGAPNVARFEGPDESELTFAFDQGADGLGPEAAELCRRLATALREPPLAYRRILLEGHSRLGPSREAAVDLSMRRADQVRACFVEQGIDPSRISALGYGSERPFTTSGDGPEEDVVRVILLD